jgi:hypothetical protein
VRKRTLTVTWTSLAIGATAGALTTLGGYVQREIRRRGYPTWEQCRCDFKSRHSIFQVWHGQHEQRGETIVAEEWGTLLRNPPQWLRRLLHHSSQVIATLNPRGNYVERVALSPQEAYQLAILLHTTSSDEETASPGSNVVWKREILHAPRYLIDICVRRLYPAHIPPERVATAQPLPALWDPRSNLPLPAGGGVLETPTGTRIDCIGWAPSQVSYCTARLVADDGA